MFNLIALGVTNRNCFKGYIQVKWRDVADIYFYENIFDFNCMFVSCRQLLAIGHAPKGGGVERTARQHPRTFSLTPGGEVCLRGIKQKYSDFRQIWVGGGGVCSHLTDFPYGNKCNALAAFVVVVVLVIAVHQL